MRIAIVTDYYLPTLGGVQTAVKAQKEALTAAGHEVTVFCPLASPSADPSVVALPVSKMFRPDGYPFTWTPERAIALMEREFAARGVQVVHTHSEMFAALAGIRAAQSLGIPLVHTMHGRIDVYTAHVLPLPALTVPLLAALHGRHVSHRGIAVASDAHYTRTRTARLMWRLMVAQARAVDHVIVPSEHFRAKLAAQGVTTPMTVLSNGLEDSVRERIGTPGVREPHDPLRLLWVGRLSPEKRPEVFVDAVARLGDAVRGDMYGDGIARAATERAVAKLERSARRPAQIGVSADPRSSEPEAHERMNAAAAGQVTLHGAVPQHEVLAAMRDADLLVSTSYDFDNQPMVMLEAIASGLPILYCDPDLAEIVPPGGGFCTPTPDAEGVAATVRTLLANPDRLRAAGAALVTSGTAVAQRADGLLKVYAGLPRARGAPTGSDLCGTPNCGHDFRPTPLETGKS